MHALFRTLAVVVCVSLPGRLSASEPARDKLVLQDLKASDVDASAADVVSGAVCRSLAEKKAFSVLCGEDLRAMLKFAALSQTLDACPSGECFGKITQALNARYLVSGQLAKVEGIYVLSLSALDGDKGEIVGRSEIKSDALARLQSDVPEAVGILLKGLAAR